MARPGPATSTSTSSSSLIFDDTVDLGTLFAVPAADIIQGASAKISAYDLSTLDNAIVFMTQYDAVTDDDIATFWVKVAANFRTEMLPKIIDLMVALRFTTGKITEQKIKKLKGGNNILIILNRIGFKKDGLAYYSVSQYTRIFVNKIHAAWIGRYMAASSFFAYWPASFPVELKEFAYPGAIMALKPEDRSNLEWWFVAWATMLSFVLRGYFSPNRTEKRSIANSITIEQNHNIIRQQKASLKTAGIDSPIDAVFTRENCIAWVGEFCHAHDIKESQYYSRY